MVYVTRGIPNNPLKAKERAEKISKAVSGINNPMYGKRGSKNPAFGKIVSEETRKKIGDKNRGKKLTPEQLKKWSEVKKGKKFSDEHKRKISESNKGKHCSEKNRQRMIENNPMKIPEIAAKQKGERNHQWKGGISFEPYCPKFTNEFKERVRAFFGYQCQMCGRVWQEGERKLAVHHANFNKQTCCNNEIPLFVPVCSGSCHAKTNNNRIFWQYWFTEMIDYLYGGQCYLPKNGVD